MNRAVLLCALGLTAALAYPLLVPNYLVTIGMLVFFTAFIGQSWNIAGGFAGQTSFGHVVFFGTGAYTSTILQVTYGWNAWLAWPAAMAAGAMDLGLICPEASGPEAAWAGGTRILAPRSLVALINHFRGSQILSAPTPGPIIEGEPPKDLRDVKGQEHAKRALEIAAAGGHNLLFCGPPGSGKSMLAQRLPSLLPPLTSSELLETSMVHSVAGLIARGTLTRARPFRAPHHSASMAALTGGGHRAKPGEVSLAHNGVLFLDELPEFGVQALDSLRGPLETGEVMVARANAHVRYPARVQLVAAMNPCRCGHGGAGRGACGKAPRCQKDYQGRISGPLLDRIDIAVDMPAVTAAGTRQSSVNWVKAD